LQEHIVVIREIELLQGVLDKAQFGTSAYGLVHSVYELYGANNAACLRTALGRLFTHCLQFKAAYTCGLADMVLKDSAEAERAALIRGASKQGIDAAEGWATTQTWLRWAPTRHCTRSW
jgi:DNA-directed RNA polymerase I subunit RPA1